MSKSKRMTLVSNRQTSTRSNYHTPTFSFAAVRPQQTLLELGQNRKFNFGEVDKMEKSSIHVDRTISTLLKNRVALGSPCAMSS